MIEGMKNTGLAIALVLAVPALTAGQASKARPAPKAQAVKELYGSMCQACHGPDGKAPIKEMGFVGRVWRTKTLAASVKTIREGVPGTAMLPFKGRLTDAEILALAKHVRALDKKPVKK